MTKIRLWLWSRVEPFFTLTANGKVVTCQKGTLRYWIAYILLGPPLRLGPPRRATDIYYTTLS